MAIEKNASYKVHNGVDFDEINFKTVAEQVKMASGIDLESGFANNKDVNGYTKLPNGMILQWGAVGYTVSSSVVNQNVTFPIAFPSVCRVVIPVNFYENVGAPYNIFFNADNHLTTGFRLVGRQVSGTSTSGSIRYIAIGY